MLLAVVGFLLAPDLLWELRAIIPIAETSVLLAAALAICAALGWWSGAGLSAAMCAVVFGLIAGMIPVGVVGSTYGTLVHGWLLLLVAAFGVASLLTPNQGFLTRALSAIGIASAAAFALAVVSPSGVRTVSSVITNEYTRRTEKTITTLDQMTNTDNWRRLAERHPSLDAMVAANEAEFRKLPERYAPLLPALVALESLVALALAWVVYHRFAAAEIGPPLGSLRDFRFNDQLIWGLAVGATIFFLPVFEDGKNAGLNLLVFFGALYLLRGVAVLSWVTRGKWAATILIVLTIFAPLLVAALALGVGVGDTWMDWRSRVQPTA